MATILDLEFLRGFSAIFAWLLIFVILYAAMELTNMLKNRGLHAFLAFIITSVLVISEGAKAAGLVVAMIPWVVVIAALIFFVLLLGQFVGLKPDQIIGVFGGKGVLWWIFAPLLIVIIIALAGPGEKKDETTENGEVNAEKEEEKSLVAEVLTNPKVLGLILILSIAAMTMMLMAAGPPSPVK